LFKLAEKAFEKFSGIAGHFAIKRTLPCAKALKSAAAGASRNRMKLKGNCKSNPP
jgi:hypothetical protein